MVRPSAFAVLRLITSSNLVGCCTGKSAGFSPLRMPTDVDAGLTIEIRIVGSVAHQAAAFNMIALEVGRGKRIARCQGHELRALGNEERVGTDEQGFGTPARESRESRVELPAGAGIVDLDVETERAANDCHVPTVGSAVATLVGLTSTATRLARGNSSCSSASRLATSSVTRK